jgi:hypothetical protein
MFIGCGPQGSPASGGAGGNGPSEPGLNKAESWYGVVTKCLFDAEEKQLAYDGGTAVLIEQHTKCSSRMTGASYSEVAKKLDEWAQTSCPDAVDIRHGTAGNYANCHLTPFGPQNAIATDPAKIDQMAASAEYCGGLPTQNHGELHCR